MTEYSDVVVRQLPFFRMCDEFGVILQGLIWTEDGSFRERFDFNPFARAVDILGIRIRWDVGRRGLSEEFVNTYWKSEEDGQFYEKKYKILFGIEYSNAEDASGMTAKATNWYRLAYHYTGIMSEKILRCKTVYDLPTIPSPHNILKTNLLKIHYLYKKCSYNDEKFNKIMSEKKPKKDDLRILPDDSTYFLYYIFTKRNYRAHMKDWQSVFSCNPKARVYSADIWTQGIYYELCKVTYEGSVWGNFLKLPKKYEKLPIFGNTIPEIENVEEIIYPFRSIE